MDCDTFANIGAEFLTGHLHGVTFGPWKIGMEFLISIVQANFSSQDASFIHICVILALLS